MYVTKASSIINSKELKWSIVSAAQRISAVFINPAVVRRAEPLLFKARAHMLIRLHLTHPH